MARHNDLGHFGEQAAVDLLTAKSYLVGHRGSRLAIVEVKTRSNPDDDPIEAVDRRKQLAMVRAGVAYAEAYKLPHELQFDIIAVSGTPENHRIEHLEDAFYPPLKTY